MSRLSEERETLPISEVVTVGTKTGRLSPFEDFQRRTLSAIDTLWGRLLYVTGLRSRDGNYQHWGHSRAHGERNSRLALARIHSDIYLQVLRTPLRDLVQEWNSDSSDAAHEGVAVSKLVVPEHLAGGSPRHLNSVALAVHLLSADRKASTRSTA